MAASIFYANDLCQYDREEQAVHIFHWNCTEKQLLSECTGNIIQVRSIVSVADAQAKY